MKIAILWTGLSGYMNACFRTLARREGVELFVVNMRPLGDAPFDESQFEWMTNRIQWQNEPDADALLRRLEQFRPGVILCSNWHIKGYRRALGRFKGRAVRIFTSDRPWLGTPRQWLGVLTARIYLHPLCEGFFVAGERQVAFAKKMGFKQHQILKGLLTCDHERFSGIHFERKKLQTEPRSFVYVGRYAPEKGLDVLVEAYRKYRETNSAPWPLKCYGEGPLKYLLSNVDGIEENGFCQPQDLPDKLLESNCLILPSSYDGWALVVHEAAAAGMPIITSDAVGASVHLVQDGYNGYIVEAGDSDELAQSMLQYSSMDQTRRSLMGESSYRMSLQFTPQRWSETLLSRTREMQAQQKGSG